MSLRTDYHVALRVLICLSKKRGQTSLSDPKTFGNLEIQKADRPQVQVTAEPSLKTTRDTAEFLFGKPPSPFVARCVVPKGALSFIMNPANHLHSSRPHTSAPHVLARLCNEHIRGVTFIYKSSISTPAALSLKETYEPHALIAHADRS